MLAVPEVAEEDFADHGTILLEDRGEGPFIREWNHLSPRPSGAALAAKKTEADTKVATKAQRKQVVVMSGGLASGLSRMFADSLGANRAARKRWAATYAAVSKMLEIGDLEVARDLIEEQEARNQKEENLKADMLAEFDKLGVT